MQVLAAQFDLLSSPTRIELLTLLTQPLQVGQIRASADLTRAGENPDRALSRQAMTRHLEQLVDAGLVTRLPAPTTPRGDVFTVNHARLFAVVDELRQIATLKPRADDPREERTLDEEDPTDHALPNGPRLVVAYGVEAGSAFPLHQSGSGKWRVGRATDAEVRLDYDPFVSTSHALVARDEDGKFTITDTGSRNRTLVNWVSLQPDVPLPLHAGDLVRVGRTLLVFQA